MDPSKPDKASALSSRRYRARWSATYACSLLDAAARSGLSLWTFAQREGLAHQWLYYWARRLGPSAAPSAPTPASEPAPAFVELRVAPRAAGLELRSRAGYKLRLPHDIAPRFVAELLLALDAGAR